MYLWASRSALQPHCYETVGLIYIITTLHCTPKFPSISRASVKSHRQNQQFLLIAQIRTSAFDELHILQCLIKVSRRWRPVCVCRHIHRSARELARKMLIWPLGAATTGKNGICLRCRIILDPGGILAKECDRRRITVKIYHLQEGNLNRQSCHVNICLWISKSILIVSLELKQTGCLSCRDVEAQWQPTWTVFVYLLLQKVHFCLSSCSPQSQSVCVSFLAVGDWSTLHPRASFSSS